MDGNRALFYNNDHKVILASYPIKLQRFKNTCQLMGWKRVYSFTPNHPSFSIGEDCLTNHHLKTQLVELIQRNPEKVNDNLGLG